MDFHSMREEAIGYYNNSSRRIQDLVHQFFDSMDTNGDGGVDFYEIHDFLYGRTFLTRFLDGEVFDGLDEDEDGSLDFYEFITLFYIIFMMFDCDECREPLMGQRHLTCVTCFTSAHENSITYDICGSCYNRGYFNHRHPQLVNYRTLILDGAGAGGSRNNSMRFQQRPTRRGNGRPQRSQPRYLGPPGQVQRRNTYSGGYTYSGGPTYHNVPERRNSTGDRRRETFGNIISALDGAHTAFELASAAAACTIM